MATSTRHEWPLVDAVLRKPFTPELLLSTIETCYEMDRPRGQDTDEPKKCL